MLRNIKLTIEYDGTHFNGWQVQGKTERTIQGEIEKALKKVFHKSIHLMGSGRTDSGVHALGQAANFKVDTSLTTQEIVRALNASLPEDIAIVDAKKVGRHFHAQYSAKSKIYRYTILNRKARTAVERNFCHFHPSPLNIRLMRQEAKVLVGRRDFKSFQATPPQDEKGKSSTRTIKRIAISRKKDFINIDFEANGFLHKMVRNIVGTLLEIGSQKFPKGSMKRILAEKNRIWAGRTARAKGLCLLKVRY